MKKYFYVFCLCFLASCATSHLGGKFSKIEEPGKDEALIYFYRTKSYNPFSANHAIGYYQIHDDKKNKITDLHSGSYYPYHVKEGEKIFTGKIVLSKSITLNVKNGKTYFVKGNVTGLGGYLTSVPNLQSVEDKSKALAEIQKCKLVQNHKK